MINVVDNREGKLPGILAEKIPIGTFFYGTTGMHTNALFLRGPGFEVIPIGGISQPYDGHNRTILDYYPVDVTLIVRDKA